MKIPTPTRTKQIDEFERSKPTKLYGGLHKKVLKREAYQEKLKERKNNEREKKQS